MAQTIHLQSVGKVPAVEAQELVVGDRLMWNFGYVSEITELEEVSPQFIRVTLRSVETGNTATRRLKKTRLVARVPVEQ